MIRNDGNRTLVIFDAVESPESFVELWSDGAWDSGFDESWPDWSPDGKTIAYTPNGSYIWLIPAETSDVAPKKLHATLGDTEVLFVAWGPDSKRLSFALLSDNPSDYDAAPANE